jgi:hypothetical protein
MGGGIEYLKCKSQRAKNVPRIFSSCAGPRGRENRKRNIERRGGISNLYCAIVWELACSEYLADVRAHVVGKPEKESLRGEEVFYQLLLYKSPRVCVLRIFGWCSGPRGGQTGKGITERRGGILSTSTVQESESLRAQNIWLMFGPTWWANRKKNHWEGGGIINLYWTRVREPACSEYSADVRAHVVGKPEKDFFLLAQAELGPGVEPAETLMVGDDIRWACHCRIK